MGGGFRTVKAREPWDRGAPPIIVAEGEGAERGRDPCGDGETLAAWRHLPSFEIEVMGDGGDSKTGAKHYYHLNY